MIRFADYQFASDQQKDQKLSQMSVWWPKGIGQWALTVLACLFGLLTSVLFIHAVHPTKATVGPGDIAELARFFPLHTLVLTAAASVLWLLARWLRARLAAGMFALVATVSAFLALWPSIAMWRYARQENVTLSLAAYIAHAAHWERGGPQLERTVEYGTAADGTRLLLDVWLSDAAEAGSLRTAIVKVHGGGWTSGRRSDFVSWNRWLNQLGYHVFDIEYRMPPPERWRDEVGDVKCALGWVAGNAAKYNIDPTRISLIGFSAGGNLAMLAAYSKGDPQLAPSCDVPSVEVRSVVNVYGPADLTMLHNSSGDLDYVRRVLNGYIGGPLAQYPDRYRLVSPVTHVGAKAPPTITVLGTSDRVIPVDQAQALDLCLESAGVAHETYLLPGNDHLFEFNWGGFGAQFAREKIRLFLKKHG